MIPAVLEGSAVAAAEITTVKTNKVATDIVFTCLSTMAMDEDNAIATYIEIGICDGERLIPIDSTPGSFAAKTSMTVYWPCVLKSGQGIYAKFATPSANDRLKVIAHGYLERAEAYNFDQGYRPV